MIIYEATRRDFLRDVDRNSLHGRLRDAFRAQTGTVPADSHGWADTYARFSLPLRNAKVNDDIHVALEYHISAAGRFRIDALLAGNDGRRDQGVIVELKAWDSAEATDVPCLVWSPIGGGRKSQHPCQQARRYRTLIEHFNVDVRDAGIGLQAAAYLFNLPRRTPEPLEDARYRDILADTPLFLANDTGPLCAFLERHVRHRARRDVVHLIDKGRLVPAPALIERVHSMLEGNEEFQLIDEQFEAYQQLAHALHTPPTDATRQVFVVEGGPGTGKSVIAVRLLAGVLREKRMGYLVAPNRAFRETLIESLARGNRGYRQDGEALIQSSWSFHTADYAKDRALDVLIVDEAHRLKDNAYMYAGESMVEDMVRAARVSIFFVDETQRVTWADTGSIARIHAAAAKFGAAVHPTLPLKAQFRCVGSDGYVNWLDDVLQIRETGNFDHWADGEYDFRVFDRADELHAALRTVNAANKARLIAGYAWEWPTKARGRGNADHHVQVDGLSLPWNFEGENWATAHDGIEQVGCVHTSQGTEFDWIGVLIGPDLHFVDGRVVGDVEGRARTDASLKGWKSELRAAGPDPVRRQAVLDRVQQIVKNTYKVLMSRGRRGCYVWCADASLRAYLRARVALAHGPAAAEVGAGAWHAQSGAPEGWLPTLPPSESRAAFLPVAAHGSQVRSVPSPAGWLRLPSGLGPDRDLFAALIEAAPPELGAARSWCIFRNPPPASGAGPILTLHACSHSQGAFPRWDLHSEVRTGEVETRQGALVRVLPRP